MNERIKELAIQAGFFYEDYKDIWYLEYHNETCDEEIKKFAELIIRECANIVQDSPWQLPQGYKSVDQAELIRKYFGIE